MINIREPALMLTVMAQNSFEANEFHSSYIVPASTSPIKSGASNLSMSASSLDEQNEDILNNVRGKEDAQTNFPNIPASSQTKQKFQIVLFKNEAATSGTLDNTLGRRMSDDSTATKTDFFLDEERLISMKIRLENIQRSMTYHTSLCGALLSTLQLYNPYGRLFPAKIEKGKNNKLKNAAKKFILKRHIVGKISPLSPLVRWQNLQGKLKQIAAMSNGNVFNDIVKKAKPVILYDKKREENRNELTYLSLIGYIRRAIFRFVLVYYDTVDCLFNPKSVDWKLISHSFVYAFLLGLFMSLVIYVVFWPQENIARRVTTVEKSFSSHGFKFSGDEEWKNREVVMLDEQNHVYAKTMLFSAATTIFMGFGMVHEFFPAAPKKRWLMCWLWVPFVVMSITDVPHIRYKFFPLDDGTYGLLANFTWLSFIAYAYFGVCICSRFYIQNPHKDECVQKMAKEYGSVLSDGKYRKEYLRNSVCNGQYWQQICFVLIFLTIVVYVIKVGAMIKNLKTAYPDSNIGEYLMMFMLSVVWPNFAWVLKDMLRRALRVISGPNPSAGRFLYTFIFSMVNMTSRILVLQFNGFFLMFITNILTALGDLVNRHTYHYFDMLSRIYGKEMSWIEALKESNAPVSITQVAQYFVSDLISNIVGIVLSLLIVVVGGTNPEYRTIYRVGHVVDTDPNYLFFFMNALVQLALEVPVLASTIRTYTINGYPLRQVFDSQKLFSPNYILTFTAASYMACSLTLQAFRTAPPDASTGICEQEWIIPEADRDKPWLWSISFVTYICRPKCRSHVNEAQFNYMCESWGNPLSFYNKMSSKSGSKNLYYGFY